MKIEYTRHEFGTPGHTRHSIDVPARKGHWMQTFTGRAYWPYDPLPEDICLHDTAHHLAMLVRYTGACREFYSIAEHSWHVSYLVQRDPQVMRAALASGDKRRYLARIGYQGLMHDSPESMLNDMNRPTKVDLKDYLALEELNWRVAFAPYYGLPYALDPAVKRADNRICLAEKTALLAPSPRSWDDWALGQEPTDVVIQGWGWRMAKARFLERFYELTEEMAHG